MTAPTGEAVNYETTVAELDAEIREMQAWLDQVTAALKCCEEAKNHVSDGQDHHRNVARALPTVVDFLTNMHLDATTLGLVGAAKDAMPASDVDLALGAVEEAEAILRRMRDAAQAALDAAQAAREHVVSEYGEEASKVAANLGGDPTFLGSGGGGGSSPAPASAAA